MWDVLMPLTLCLLSLWATPEASLKSLAIEYTPPRPISLDNLPVDVVLFIADYLSVKDLVRVAQVNSSARHLFRTKSIWFLALHDILQVRPLPRLQLALPSLSRDALIEACVRSYRLDGVFGTHSHDVTLRRRAVLDMRFPTGSAWIVPGGRYYLLFFENRQMRMALYKTLDGSKVMDILDLPGRPRIPFHVRPQIVPVSPDKFLVGHLFEKAVHSDEWILRVVLCDSISGQVSDVFGPLCRFDILDFDLTPSRIALMTCAEKKVYRIEVYAIGAAPTERPLLLIDLHGHTAYSRENAILTFVTATQLLVGTCSGVSIVDVPADNASTPEEGVVVLRSTWQQSDILDSIFLRPLVGRCHLQTYPEKLFVWGGPRLQMFCRSTTDDPTWTTASFKLSVSPITANGTIPALGMTCGVYQRPQKSTSRHTTFCIHSLTGEAAQRRLDRCGRDVEEGSIGGLCPPGYELSSMSYDEESGVYVAIAANKLECVLLVLDMLA